MRGVRGIGEARCTRRKTRGAWRQRGGSVSRKEVDPFPGIREQAEHEAQAQLVIIRALRKLPDRLAVQRVMKAVVHLTIAEDAVPGVFAAFLKGMGK